MSSGSGSPLRCGSADGYDSADWYDEFDSSGKDELSELFQILDSYVRPTDGGVAETDDAVSASESSEFISNHDALELNIEKKSTLLTEQSPTLSTVSIDSETKKQEKTNEEKGIKLVIDEEVSIYIDGVRIKFLRTKHQGMGTVVTPFLDFPVPKYIIVVGHYQFSNPSYGSLRYHLNRLLHTYGYHEIDELHLGELPKQTTLNTLLRALEGLKIRQVKILPVLSRESAMDAIRFLPPSRQVELFQNPFKVKEDIKRYIFQQNFEFVRIHFPIKKEWLEESAVENIAIIDCELTETEINGLLIQWILGKYPKLVHLELCYNATDDKQELDKDSVFENIILSKTTRKVKTFDETGRATQDIHLREVMETESSCRSTAAIYLKKSDIETFGLEMFVRRNKREGSVDTDSNNSPMNIVELDLHDGNETTAGITFDLAYQYLHMPESFVYYLVLKFKVPEEPLKNLKYRQVRFTDNNIVRRTVNLGDFKPGAAVYEQKIQIVDYSDAMLLRRGSHFIQSEFFTEDGQVNLACYWTLVVEAFPSIETNARAVLRS